MALNITAIWEALFDTSPSNADLTTFEGEDASLGDAATIATIIASSEVQQEVIPVIQIIQLATGLAPNASQLANWVNAANTEGLLAVAQAWVNNSNFQAQYGSTSTSIINGIYAKAFGTVPTPGQVTAWSADSPAQILLAFATSTIYTNHLAPYVTQYLTDVMEAVSGEPGALFPSGSLTSLPVVVINQVLELTVGQDSAISGQAFDGTGATVLTSGVEINAPLGGVFGNQATLTPADDISLSGTGNILNATFDGSELATGVTIQGVQTWNIQNVDPAPGHEVAITGTAGTISGVTSLTYNDNEFGNTLLVGLPTAGITQPTGSTENGFSLTVENAMGDGNGAGGHSVELFFAPTSFGAADAISVTASVVGNTLGGTGMGAGSSYSIVAGSSTKGFATWNVNSVGALAASSVNNIALGANGSTAATALNIQDDGSSTIVYASFAGTSAGAADWAELTTINASVTSGQLTVTGGEHGTSGLLTDDTTALTSVTGGTGADLFDLSGYAGTTAEVKGLSIMGGGNTTGTNSLGDTGTGVELSNAEINTISGVASGAFDVWNGVAILYDASDDVGGTINMADFPGTLTVSLLTAASADDPTQTSGIIVKNAPDGLTFDFNDTNENHESFSATGSDTAGGTANVLTVNYDVIKNATATFTTRNFDHVNVNLSGFNGDFAPTSTFYSGGVQAIANADAAESLTITATETFGEFVVIPFPHFVDLPVTVDVGDITAVAGIEGPPTITLLGGPIVVSPPTAQFTDTGTLTLAGSDNFVIGVTNASTIDSTTTGTFDMAFADDIVATGTAWKAQSGVMVTSESADSTLQGSWGPNTGLIGSTTAVGNDTLTDLAGDSNFFGDGGQDMIKIGDGGNTIHIGSIVLEGTFTIFTETAPNDAALGFWGAQSNGQAIFGSAGAIFGIAPEGGTSNDMTTITGFTLGTGGDFLNINPGSWDDAGNHLIDAGSATGAAIPFGSNAGGHTFAVGFAGETITTSAYLVLDEISDITSAKALALSLSTATVGDFNLDHTVASGASVEILVAYQSGTSPNTVNIADVLLHNASGIGQTDTADMHVYASDLVSLSGVSYGLNILGINAGEIHFAT